MADRGGIWLADLNPPDGAAPRRAAPSYAPNRGWWLRDWVPSAHALGYSLAPLRG